MLMKSNVLPLKHQLMMQLLMKRLVQLLLQQLVIQKLLPKLFLLKNLFTQKFSIHSVTVHMNKCKEITIIMEDQKESINPDS